MQYSLFVAWRYMKKNPGRTFYSILGIMVTFILSFSIFTAGYSYWDYMYLSEEVDKFQMFVELDEEMYDAATARYVGLTQEGLERIKKLAQCEEVGLLRIREDVNGEFQQIPLDEVRVGGSYGVAIGLKDTSEIQKTAEILQEKTNLTLWVDQSALEYFGQAKGGDEDESLWNSIIVMVGAIFSFFCVMILRNTMMISVVERMQDYGLWRCVGMSEKQLYRQLAVEGFIISLLAAACGIGVGFGLIQLIGIWLNHSIDFEVPFRFAFYPKAVIYTTLLCVGVTLFSLLEPARQVGNLSPIEAIHNNIVLRGRKGKLWEKIQYRQSCLWTKLFGVSGEYAYKNMYRNRGRSVGLFFSLMFCVALIGLTQSAVKSLYASVKNAYQGRETEYLEIISPAYGEEQVSYDEKQLSRIAKEVNQIPSVQKTAVLFEKEEARSLDPLLKKYKEEGKIDICEHYAYDQEQVAQLKQYLIEGEIDYQAMTEQRGVLLCDMQYNVSNEETDFNQMDIRKTEYQVGDTITILSGEGRKRAKSIYENALQKVAKQAGIAATWEEWNAAGMDEEDVETEESEGSSEPDMETEESEDSSEPDAEAEESEDGSEPSAAILEDISEGEEGYGEYLQQMLDLIATEEGIRIRPKEVAAVGLDPETGKRRSTEVIGSIYNVLEQREYENGAVETYVILGIVSEDPINGAVTEMNMFNPLTLIHAQDAILPEKEGWNWCLEVQRDPLNLQNGDLDQYCAEQKNGIALSSYYVFEGTDYDIMDYLNMLHSMNVVHIVIVIITVGIVIICLIQIFNTLCANIVLRRKEFWLYSVVGMSRRQKYQMLLLEHGVAAVAAVVLGYLLSWGLSWYLIAYLLDQNGTILYEWPGFFMLLVSAGILLLVELISVVGIRTTSEK